MSHENEPSHQACEARQTADLKASLMQLGATGMSNQVLLTLNIIETGIAHLTSRI